MRYSVFAVILTCTFIGMFTASCDLLDKSVLVDDGKKNIINDSTTIRVMNSMPDSTELIIETTADWHANVAKDGDWCSISKQEGRKGRDTIHVHVDENTSTIIRETSIVVESGTNILIFKVMQRAAEGWLDVIYWNRTALQRMGIHGIVESIAATDNSTRTEFSSEYHFDQRGNLLSEQSIRKATNKYETKRTYTYDESNHRLTCSVTDNADVVVRKWKYEYGNTDKLVAFSAKGWSDPDPLAEDMEGMIVPDLSAAYKSWKEGGFEYHEDRLYVFEEEMKLVIYIEQWKDSAGTHVPVMLDTMRVSYQFFDGGKLRLPQKGRGYVDNSLYYSNGMLKMMETKDGKYDFLDNVQRMVVSSFAYTGDAAADHDIDSYHCEYNSNRDLIERRIYYNKSQGVTVESYPQYQYDDQHNWTARVEEINRPEYSQAINSASKRDYVYYRNY